MALTRNDAIVTPFNQGIPPVDQKNTLLFLMHEMQRLQITVQQLVTLCPQVAVEEPLRKLRGMIRWAKAPWDPLGSGDALVVWNGAKWVSVASAAGLALDADLKTLIVSLTTEQKLTNLILQAGLSTSLDDDISQLEQVELL